MFLDEIMNGCILNQFKATNYCMKVLYLVKVTRKENRFSFNRANVAVKANKKKIIFIITEINSTHNGFRKNVSSKTFYPKIYS